MKVIRPIIGLCCLGAAAFLGHLAYEGELDSLINSPSSFRFSKLRHGDFAEQVKEKLLKYQKPARIEVTNYIRNPEHPYQKDIQEIKKLKIPQNPEGTYYIQINFFADETDVNAPLVAQIMFLDLKTNNIIEESSLTLIPK